MTSIHTPSARSDSDRRPRRVSGDWATLCAETLTGIADPLFPALTLARQVEPADAARALLGGLLEPVDTPAAAEPALEWLLPHQADAVRRSRAILARFNGVLVADGVGLGKTYVALALAALERRAGGDAVAIVPAALRADWQRAGRETGVVIPVLSHTELARSRPPLTPRCSLLLVDEAHGFRNPHTRRYDALARLAAGRRVALLTATPFNNRPADLAALLHLFAARDRFREFGCTDIVTDLAAGSGGAELALAAVSVCRTRRFVEERFPALRAALPRRVLLPPARYDLAGTYGALDELLAALAAPFGGADAEAGAALLRLGLMRRLESSPHALRRTLLRHRAFLEECVRARESGVVLSRRVFQAAMPRGETDDAQMVLWPLLGGEAAGPASGIAAWKLAIDRALALLDTAPRDAKLPALEALLDGPLAGQRTIVFTEHRDTAVYLLRHLRRTRRVIAVLGSGAWAGTSRVTRREALDAFAPHARGRAPDPLLTADLLVATDVASEGMNLQDASAVVNYDLPWNPVRVMQRVGRVDRLHSRHERVFVAHLVPARGLEQLSGVLRALRAKLELSAPGPGAEPDPLAALWWIDDEPAGDALEREMWHRVAPFEARERWRALVNLDSAPRRAAPVVSGGIVTGGGPPQAALLLALEWPDGKRIPLPYVMDTHGRLSTAPGDLAAVAERALNARALPASAGEFTELLGTALAHARSRLVELSAQRHGTRVVGPGRRAALDLIERHASALGHDRESPAHLERALLALSHELPAGVDNLLGRLLQAPGAPDDTARRIAEIVEKVAPPAPPDLRGLPKLVLVAAIVLAVE